MARFIGKNLLHFALLMLAVSVVTFALVGLSPIDPVQANVGQNGLLAMSAEKRAQLASYWGADLPIWERYLNWAGAFITGDWGSSLRFNAPVTQVIATRAANSLLLLAAAWLISGVLGFALGVLAVAFFVFIGFGERLILAFIHEGQENLDMAATLGYEG